MLILALGLSLAGLALIRIGLRQGRRDAIFSVAFWATFPEFARYRLKRLGPDDWLMVWKKGSTPSQWLSKLLWLALPKEITVRIVRGSCPLTGTAGCCAGGCASTWPGGATAGAGGTATAGPPGAVCTVCATGAV